MGVKLKVIVQPDAEDGGFIASCPALPGCHSQGETRDEALTNIREAVEGCLLALNERAGLHAVASQVAEIEV